MADLRDVASFVFVTAVYDIGRDEYERTLWNNCVLLAAACPFNVIMYVWCDSSAVPPAELLAFPHVYILNASLVEFSSFVAGMTPGLQLPTCRNSHKDTALFMALINAKVDMVAEAARLDARVEKRRDSVVYAWIDAGIVKLWDGNVDALRARLSSVVHMSVPSATIIVPGIWTSMLTLDGACDNKVCWRFCGGFFAVAGDSVQHICGAIRDRFLALVESGRTTWEVNVWALIEAEKHACPESSECATRFNIVWCKSQHDITFFSSF